jgi:hypothetical protein
LKRGVEIHRQGKKLTSSKPAEIFPRKIKARNRQETRTEEGDERD